MGLKVLKVILNTEELSFFRCFVRPYNKDGCIDFTARMNIRPRGVTMNESSNICNRLYHIGLTSFMLAVNNVLNMVGLSKAEIDQQELTDTLSFYTEIKIIITDSGRGRAEHTNHRQNFIIRVSGLRDDFDHTHICDIDLLLVTHDDRGKFGFKVAI